MLSLVCGYDGEIYSSECEAFVVYVIVDYLGFCRVVGYFLGKFYLLLLMSGMCEFSEGVRG